MKWLLTKSKALLDALHPTPQNALTLRLPIKEPQEAELREVLAEINQDPADNPILPFSVFSKLHFARFIVLDGPDHPQKYGSTLVLLANIDGPVADFLDELLLYSNGLDQVLQACRGYPLKGNRQKKGAYLRAHQLPSQAYYINTIGRSAAQIRQEDELREALQTFLDGLEARDFRSASDVREAVIRFVGEHPELAWALAQAAQRPLLSRLVDRAIFSAYAALGLLIVAWGWPLLLAWLLALRKREFSDEEYTHRAPLSRVNQLRAAEDIATHNPFAAVGYVKPGWLRLTTTRALLAAAQVVLRHVFNNGNLAGIPLLGLDGVDTIHFARWTLLDDNRRLLFTSNYDGSLESYMVDFIDKVAWGLNLIFSNGVGYPLTRWIVHEGARKEQRFKDYLALHQIDNQVWYSPYPHLTAVNIANNAAIRKGLSGSMTEREASAWLRRL